MLHDARMKDFDTAAAVASGGVGTDEYAGAPEATRASVIVAPLSTARRLRFGAHDMSVAIVAPPHCSSPLRRLMPPTWRVRCLWELGDVASDWTSWAGICFAPSELPPDPTDNRLALLSRIARSSGIPVLCYLSARSLPAFVSLAPVLHFRSALVAGTDDALVTNAVLDAVMDPVRRQALDVIESAANMHFALRRLLRDIVMQPVPMRRPREPRQLDRTVTRFVRHVKDVKQLQRVDYQRSFLFQCAKEAGVSLHRILQWNALLHLWPRLALTHGIASEFGFPSDDAMEKWIVRTVGMPLRRMRDLDVGTILDRLIDELRGADAHARASAPYRRRGRGLIVRE